MLAFLPIALWLINIAIYAVGYLLFRPKRNQKPETPMQSFKISAVKIGSPIPVVFGIAKTGGLIIDWWNWTTIAHRQSQSAKGK